jgi:hypothetical protein
MQHTRRTIERNYLVDRAYIFISRLLKPPASRTSSGSVEYVYALLPSWGMHRMGGGPKMHEFSEFHSSMQAVWPIALSLPAPRLR